MSADRTSFVISKPLIDATTAKIMPTSAVQLLHQSSYFDFFKTHLTLISYVRLISFELHKLLNSLRRKPIVEQFILFSFDKPIYFWIFWRTSSLMFLTLFLKDLSCLCGLNSFISNSKDRYMSNFSNALFQII